MICFAHRVKCEIAVALVDDAWASSPVASVASVASLRVIITTIIIIIIVAVVVVVVGVVVVGAGVDGIHVVCRCARKNVYKLLMQTHHAPHTHARTRMCDRVHRHKTL